MTGGGAQFRPGWRTRSTGIRRRQSTMASPDLARKIASEHNLINLTPPGEEDRAELRDDGLDNVLVESIETIRAAVASAAGGDDPFVLNDSTITIPFAVTAAGSISIGVNGSLSDELTHRLVLALVPAQGSSIVR